MAGLDPAIVTGGVTRLSILNTKDTKGGWLDWSAPLN